MGSSLGAVFVQEQPGGLYGGEAGLAQAFLAAVVENDVGGAVLLLVSRDASNGPGCDLFCADGLPVFWEDVPLDRREAE